MKQTVHWPAAVRRHPVAMDGSKYLLWSAGLRVLCVVSRKTIISVPERKVGENRHMETETEQNQYDIQHRCWWLCFCVNLPDNKRTKQISTCWRDAGWNFVLNIHDLAQRSRVVRLTER